MISYILTRSYDRDEVLTHVKQHYIDAGLLISAAAQQQHQKQSLHVPKLDFLNQLSLMEPPPSRVVTNLMQVMPDVTIKTPPPFPPLNGEPQTSTGADQLMSATHEQITSILTHNNQLASSTSQVQLQTQQQMSLEQGVVVQTGGGGTGAAITNNNLNNNPNNNINNSSNFSQRQVGGHGSSTTTTNTTTTTSTTTSNSNNSNTWRGPAPYRCGHCHQVSNWKHVIQVLR